MRDLLANAVVQVPLSAITVSRQNTRMHYDPEALSDLTDSVREIGQIYPVVVRRLGRSSEKFELIIGTRRLKVAYKRKMSTIPAFVVDQIEESEVVIFALSENLHRNDLTPFEEAKAILKLCKDFDMDPRLVAKRIGKPLPYVQSRLKLLSIPTQVQDILCRGGVTMSHVGILTSLKKPRDQIRYAKLVQKESLSQTDLITLIQDDLGTTSVPQRPAARRLFSPKRTAVKISRFRKFLDQKVRPRLALGGDEARDIRKELRLVREEIRLILGRSRSTHS